MYIVYIRNLLKEYPQMYWMGQLSMYYVSPILVVFASVNYNCNTNHCQ